jgi:hypothetical protein
MPVCHHRCHHRPRVRSGKSRPACIGPSESRSRCPRTRTRTNASGLSSHPPSGSMGTQLRRRPQSRPGAGDPATSPHLPMPPPGLAATTMRRWSGAGRGGQAVSIRVPTRAGAPLSLTAVGAAGCLPSSAPCESRGRTEVWGGVWRYVGICNEPYRPIRPLATPLVTSEANCDTC